MNPSLLLSMMSSIFHAGFLLCATGEDYTWSNSDILNLEHLSVKVNHISSHSFDDTVSFLRTRDTSLAKSWHPCERRDRQRYIF